MESGRLQPLFLKIYILDFLFIMNGRLSGHDNENSIGQASVSSPPPPPARPWPSGGGCRGRKRPTFLRRNCVARPAATVVMERPELDSHRNRTSKKMVKWSEFFSKKTTQAFVKLKPEEISVRNKLFLMI